jgi:DNA polymerase III delta prime subunit
MSLPLIEKWRPRTFEDVIGVRDLNTLITIISKPQEMPNLLFYGPQGTGKTTVAKIIMEQLKPIDVLRINGSDTTGIDTIRENVFNFITSMSSVSGKPKIVWIEEFDYMSQNAFAALRAMIEQYIKNARFICTCNYPYKIPSAILSRFSLFEFTKPENHELLARLKYICEQENIIVTDTILEVLIENSKGDIRAVINLIQKLSSNESKSISMQDLSELETIAQEVYKLIRSKNWTKLRMDIPSKYPDYNKLLVDLEGIFFNSELPIPKKADITELI